MSPQLHAELRDRRHMSEQKVLVGGGEVATRYSPTTVNASVPACTDLLPSLIVAVRLDRCFGGSNWSMTGIHYRIPAQDETDQASRSGFDRATRSLRLRVLAENAKQKKLKTAR
jgi:hypothetical protein